jgi:hypothetical protein
MKNLLFKTTIRLGCSILGWICCFSINGVIAQVTILATGQEYPTNLIVDGSRVYWNTTYNGFQYHALRSVDKLNGGPVATHASGFPMLEAMTQDGVALYFAADLLDGNGGSIYKVLKTSSSPVAISWPGIGLGGTGYGLVYSNGRLYYLGAVRDVPGYMETADALVSLSTQGGTETVLLWNAYFTSATPNFNFGYSDFWDQFSTDNANVYWSSQDGAIGISHVPLVGGLTAQDVGGSDIPGVLATPSTGPSGGYVFWIDTTTSTLKMRTPGGGITDLVPNITNPDVNSCRFVVVGSNVYCEQQSQIVQASIYGGAPTIVVPVQDALGPIGLASDGAALYWTAVDGSVRSWPLLPSQNHPSFFTGETALGGGWYYLQFANGTPFGYYSYLTDPNYIYHLDLGFEYLFDANDVNHAIYFYDFASSSFFYTSPTLFPDLYDFSLNAWLYYLPDASNPGHYSQNPRWFYNFATGQWITL